MNYSGEVLNNASCPVPQKTKHETISDVLAELGYSVYSLEQLAARIEDGDTPSEVASAGNTTANTLNSVLTDTPTIVYGLIDRVNGVKNRMESLLF